MGEVVKCTVLGRYEKIPADKLIGTIILERLIDAISLLLVFGITLVLQPGIYQKLTEQVFVSNGSGEEKGGLSGMVIFLLIVAAIIIGIAAWMLIKKKTLRDLGAALRRVLTKVWQGIGSIRHLQQRGQFLLLSLLMWTLYLTGGYLGFKAIEATEIYGFKEAFTVLSAGSIGMVLFPGGIGGYPFLVEKTMMMYGLSSAIAIAFGWLLWIAQTLIILVGGCISFALIPWYNRRLANKRNMHES